MCRSTSTSHPLTAWGLYLLCVLSMGLTGITGQAATFTVTNLNDGGIGSLRQAILNANATTGTGTNTIVFQSGLNGRLLTIGNLRINRRLEVIGPGADVLTLFSNGNDIFVIERDAAATLSGLKLSNGQRGIYNSGKLTVENSIISDNAKEGIYNYNSNAVLIIENSTLSDNAEGGIYNYYGTATVNRSIISGNLNNYGGGIENDRGIVTINRSILSGNTSRYCGGGIHSDGTLTVSHSTISNNTSNYNSCHAGGGIFSDGSVLNVTYSTLSGNAARGGCGGGVYVRGATAFTFYNNTLSGNTARYGGGLYAYGNIIIKIVNNTISANTANDQGGGIYIEDGVLLSIGNSIVSGNTAPTAIEIRNDNATFVSEGYNLFGVNGISGLVGANAATTDIILPGLINSAIGSLTDNGGPTRTHLLVIGSPALNAGSNALVFPGVTTAQRGEVRIQNGRVDIGAVEGTEIVISPEQTLTSHYYQAILNRSPDSSGQNFWINEIARMQLLDVDVQEAFRVMAGLFFNSTEYSGRGTNNTQFLTDLYRTFFNRDPDSGGLNYWNGLMTAGMPRDLVMYGFLFSAEFATTMQGLFGNTAKRPEVNTVVDFYRGILNRLPDEDGFRYWLAQFRTSQCMGASAVTTTTNAISQNFLNSNEYTGRGRTNSQYVADLYYAFLRRAGDLDGYNYWLSQLNNGLVNRDQVRISFINSPEFQGRVNQIINAGCAP